MHRGAQGGLKTKKGTVISPSLRTLVAFPRPRAGPGRVAASSPQHHRIRVDLDFGGPEADGLDLPDGGTDRLLQ